MIITGGGMVRAIGVLFLVFCFDLMASNQDVAPCEMVWTDIPPFMVTSATGMNIKGTSWDRDYENLYFTNDTNKKHRYIRRGSLVRVIGNHRVARDKRRDDRYLPVQVLAVPGGKTDRRAEASRYPLNAIVLNETLERAEVGDRGRLIESSLEHAGGYTYLVTKPTLLSHIPGFDDNTLMQSRALRLVTRESAVGKKEYRAQQCCTYTSPPDHRTECKYHHMFEVLDKKGSVLGDVGFDLKNPSCDFADGVMPVAPDQARALSEIAELTSQVPGGFPLEDLQIISSEGLVKWPVNDRTGEGALNTDLYNPDLQNEIWDESFLKMTTACTLAQVLKAWDDICPEPRCEVQLGDMWHPKMWDDHSEHESGECFDMRPLSKDVHDLGLTFRDGSYDPEQNQKFTNLLIAAGADRSKLFFNGPVKGVKKLFDKGIPKDRAGHSHENHYHVCFRESDPRVKEVCERGLVLPAQTSTPSRRPRSGD